MTTSAEPTPPQPLQWGETPWDHLPREELLREVWRLHQAVRQLLCVVPAARRPEHGPPTEAEQARAVAYSRVALAHANRYSQQDRWRHFFRYADELLFPGVVRGVWGNWHTCPAEHCFMVAPDIQALGPVGCPHCPAGTLAVPLTWADLEPKAGRREPVPPQTSPREDVGPPYNHTRGDSALYPCPLCALELALDRLGVQVAGTRSDPLRWSKTDLLTDLRPLLMPEHGQKAPADDREDS